MANNTKAVIVRRSKKPGHAQRHGGHWKVAYADFMTAMMAFFLLLWILAVTDDKKLEGIAQYFTPTEHIAGQPGGEGILQGSAVAQDENVLSNPSQEMKADQGAPNPWAKLAEEAESEAPPDAPIGEALERAGEQFLLSVKSQPELANLAGNLLVRQIEGQLVVDILDLGEGDMFAAGESTVTESLQLVLEALAPTVIALPHPIRITGHAGLGEDREADPWEVSSLRAHAVRRELDKAGLDPARYSLISGAGSSRPLDPLQPQDPRNRRVTIELGSALD